jgi:hypothetical protein
MPGACGTIPRVMSTTPVVVAHVVAIVVDVYFPNGAVVL